VGLSIGLHHPEQRPPEKEEVSDNDYFDELESPNPYLSDIIGSGDADLGPLIATPRFPSSDSPAERVFGEERPDDGKMRDRLHDRADEADAFDDLFGNKSRTPPTESNSIKIEATTNESLEDFGEFGQTEHRQAVMAEQAKEYEKELCYNNENRKLHIQLMTMKRDAMKESAEQAKNISFLTSALAKVVKQAKPESADPSQAMREMMDAKVNIKAMKRATSVEVENSEHHFKGALDQMGLLAIAMGEKEGSVEEEKRLSRAAMRWVGDDERIVSSIRTKLGSGAKGTILCEHIKAYFIQPMVGDASDAEKKFKAFDYKAMYGGSEENMHEYFDEFANILSHLSVRRQGDPEEWVEFLSEELPDDLATEYDRYVRKLTRAEVRKASTDVTTFALYLGKALTRLRSKKPKVMEELPVMNLHQTKPYGGASSLQEVASLIPGHRRLIDPVTKVEFNVCPGCSFRKCLKANDPKASCDVCDPISPERAAAIAKMYGYKSKVDEKRARLNKAPCDYTIKNSMHQQSRVPMAEGWDEEMMAKVDELAKQDFTHEGDNGGW